MPLLGSSRPRPGTAARHAATIVPGGDVELGLSGATFCDSVGLCALSTAGREMRTAGRTLRLVDPAPCVARLLELTATSHLFDVAARLRSSGDIRAN